MTMRRSGAARLILTLGFIAGIRPCLVEAQTGSVTITVREISPVIQGNEVSVTCDIHNGSSVSRTFGVGAEIRDSSTLKADLGTSTTSSISAGSSASVTFARTIPADWTAKDYTLHAVLWSGTPGSSTWLNDDSRTFTVVAQTTAATITVREISSVIQGNQMSATCDIRNDSNVSRTFGVGAEIEDGSTIKADLGTRTTASLSPGASTSATFVYTIPTGWTAKSYTLHAAAWSGTPGSSTWLDDGTRTFAVVARTVSATVSVDPIATVDAGDSVTIAYTITSTGNVNNSFGVGCELWKDTTRQVDLGSQSTGSLAPGGSVSGTFTYAIPTAWNGSHFARTAVWSGTPGASTSLNSVDTSFSVTPAPLPALTGRIAFHRDSNNTSLHAPGSADDGHVYVFNLDGGTSASKATSGLPLGNAMNPHFSPDGSKVVFMAIPSGQTLLWDNMRTYVLDLAENTHTDLGSGQDPKFSPDGAFIVFKRDGQIWRMPSDGGSAVQLTSSTGEKSGPNYSPDGATIVYWLNGGANADIWGMNADGSGAAALVANASIQDYYPIYRDADNILYSRWDSSENPHPDKIYNLQVSSGTSTKLGLNSAGTTYEDADAFAIEDWVGFSSTRKGGGADYDLYIAADCGSPFGEIAAANSTLAELGGVYSPYAYARKVRILAPADAATLAIGTSYTLQVRAYSDGGVWADASPSVTLAGPQMQTYTALKDDGTGGDQTPGDGIYSIAITLPSTTGAYSITAGAVSSDNGLENNLASQTVNVTLYQPAPPAPTGVAATDGTYTDRVRVRWNVASTATAYEVWRHTSNDSGSATKISAADPTTTAYNDTTAVPGTTYYYWVKAKNAGGASPFSTSDAGWRALSPPGGVSATDGTSMDRTTITWNAVTGAGRYQVYRNTSDESATAVSLAGWGTATSYSDSGAEPGQTYYYWVKAAVDSSGTRASGFSASDAGFRKADLRLSVSPATHSVSSAAGSTTFDVSNAGTGTMPWTAQVVSGEGWLSISSGAGGANSGTITVAFTQNTVPDSRTGTVRITADGATGSPADVTVTQSGVCKLTVSVVGGHGTVSPTSQSYEYGQVASLQATPATGYRVKSWSGTDDDSSKAAANTVTMTSDKTVTVQFEPIPCALTASVIGGHGTVSPTSKTYDYGQVASLQATPATGYRVKSWSGTDDDASKAAVNSVTMTSDRTVTVRFELIPCTLTASVAAGQGTISPTSQIYNYGQTASLQATPDAGWRVKAWSGTDNDASTARTNAATMIADKTVTVEFELIPPTALTIGMADSADPVDANDPVTYTITYGNAGYPDAGNTVIAETLPSGLTLVSAPGGEYDASTRVITWNVGTLPSETTGQTISFIVTVDGSMADGGTITHSQLTIDCDQADPVAALVETTTVNDTLPPRVSGCVPAAGAELAACGGMIRLHVTDGGSGVRYDGGTVVIRIEGDLVYDGANETSEGVYDTRASAQRVTGLCRRTGTPADYEFAFKPSGRFDYQQSVDVVATVFDVAGNTGAKSYSFSTESRFFGRNARVNSDTGTLAQDHPTTAVDSAGDIWVVWDQQVAAGNTDVYIGQLPAGAGAFEASAAVYAGPGVQSRPVIAADDDGLYVAWQSQASNGNWDIRLSRSDDGVTWTPPVTVNTGDPNNTSSQRSPSIAIGGSSPGVVYVAFDDDRAGNRDIWVAVSTDGTAWTETQVTTDAAEQTSPKVVVDPNDHVARVLWTDARDAATQGTNIYAASSADSWSNVAVVTGAANETDAVAAVHGAARFVWISSESAPSSVRYGSDAGGLPIAGAAIADEAGAGQASPSLSLRHDAGGTKLFAAWQDGRNVNGNGDTDIYFAEGDSALGTNILVNDDPGTSAQSAPVVGVDREGNPYVVWVDERNGNKDIYYAGAVAIGDPVPTTVITSDDKTTVRATDQANLEVEIPQMPDGVQAEEITIAEVSNPPQMPSGTGAIGLKYEFGPTGLQFETPATIRIPLTDDGGYTAYRIYRYDPNDLTSPLFPWTESGIHNPASKVVGADGTYLEVRVDHFSIYGGAGITVSSSGGGGGGGGGGCALSPYSGGRPLESVLPLVLGVLVLFGLTRAQRRRRCR